MNLDLLVYKNNNQLDKKINLTKYFLYDIGTEPFKDGRVDLRKLKKRIPICYDIRSALEAHGYDSFKFIKEKSSYNISFSYQGEEYEIRNLKLKEPSIIGTLIDLVVNLFTVL